MTHQPREKAGADPGSGQESDRRFEAVVGAGQSAGPNPSMPGWSPGRSSCGHNPQEIRRAAGRATPAWRPAPELHRFGWPMCRNSSIGRLSEHCRPSSSRSGTADATAADGGAAPAPGPIPRRLPHDPRQGLRDQPPASVASDPPCAAPRSVEAGVLLRQLPASTTWCNPNEAAEQMGRIKAADLKQHRRRTCVERNIGCSLQIANTWAAQPAPIRGGSIPVTTAGSSAAGGKPLGGRSRAAAPVPADLSLGFERTMAARSRAGPAAPGPPPSAADWRPAPPITAGHHGPRGGLQIHQHIVRGARKRQADLGEIARSHKRRLLTCRALDLAIAAAKKARAIAEPRRLRDCFSRQQAHQPQAPGPSWPSAARASLTTRRSIAGGLLATSRSSPSWHSTTRQRLRSRP